MTEPMPDDSKRAKRVALIASASVFVVGLLAIGVWATVVRSGDSAQPEQYGYEPAEQTSEPTLPVVPSSTPSVTPTSSATPTQSTPGSVVTAAGATRTPKVAFRLGGTVYVAREDGSAPVSVVRSAEGPFALSPDGKTLALVEGGTLALFDVATKTRRVVGPAELAMPSWRPDSTAVHYLRLGSSAGGTPEVWRVEATGAGAKRLEAGMEAAVSPDGKTTVLRPLDAGYSSPEDAARLLISVGDAFEPISLAGQPTAVAVSNDRIFVALVDARGESSIVSIKHDGSGSKKILGGPLGSVGAVWGRLTLSPDASMLAVTAMGDDGFSRVRTVPAGGGTSTDLTPRRDAEVYGWTAAGDALLLVEGNRYQGEPSALVRIRPDATKRVAVVTGVE